MDAAQRDKWLILEDSVFLRDCRLDLFHASGHGGQKVNKSSTAVRLTHLPSGVSASCQESRSQTENRGRALKRLRLALAFSIRSETSEPPSLENIPSERNQEYPRYVAALLDALEKALWDLKASAQIFGISPSKLAKILYRDPDVWQEVQRQRAGRGLAPLNAPK